jgi:hypothetical protein
MLTPVEPRVSVVVSDVHGVGEGHWQVTWTVHNNGPESLALEAAWIPHGRFRGEGRMPLSGSLDAGAMMPLHFVVSAAESSGTVVENAFLILRVMHDGQAWRIFTRMRIEFDAQAVPTPVIELITTQPIT